MENQNPFILFSQEERTMIFRALDTYKDQIVNGTNFIENNKLFTPGDKNNFSKQYKLEKSRVIALATTCSMCISSYKELKTN